MLITNLFPYWHDINTPPPDNSTVLIYYEDSRGGNYAIATWENGIWWFPGSHINDYTVTAWQELPNKPVIKIKRF